MKTCLSSYFLFLFCLNLLLPSCQSNLTITKRRYNPGYHLDWIKKEKMPEGEKTLSQNTSISDCLPEAQTLHEFSISGNDSLKLTATTQHSQAISPLDANLDFFSKCFKNNTGKSTGVVFHKEKRDFLPENTNPDDDKKLPKSKFAFTAFILVFLAIGVVVGVGILFWIIILSLFFGGPSPIGFFYFLVGVGAILLLLAMIFGILGMKETMGPNKTKSGAGYALFGFLAPIIIIMIILAAMI
jgi:hypothetical protein